MKKFIALPLFFLFLSGHAQFDKYFENKTLRMDYFQSGNFEQEIFTFDELIEEPYWGGSKINLIDTFNYGENYVKVYNLADNTLIYSRGYSTLFREWQTTTEAKTTWRTLSETVVFPFPKQPVRIELFRKNWEGEMEKKFEYVADPKNYFIKKDRRHVYPVLEVLKSGDPAIKLDVVILPEGYTSEEMDLFKADCQAFADHFFDFEPYTGNKDKFNIYGVLAPSPETGTDIPADTVWKTTLMNTSFYTFDSERYCMTFDDKSVRDLAANVPYDQIYILVNSPKYGGGAIYNYYNISVNSNAKAAKIFIHEFGHGFAGLGDEYFDSSTSYNDFYNLKVEPWEPNITTLVDFSSKWENMVPPGTPVPTPADTTFMNTVGVFEGGGYVAKGVYRPMIDCMMMSFKGDHFCPVCQVAIQKMIDFYAK